MTEVDELTGTEGGIWRVWTQGSSYVMDLEQMTVTRHPGPNSGRSINDTTRPIRNLTTCRVGSSGYWTMHAGGDVLDEIDLYWQVTTEIRKIERIDTPDEPITPRTARTTTPTKGTHP